MNDILPFYPDAVNFFDVKVQYIYLLECTGLTKYYAGSTSSLSNRLLEHLRGRTTATKTRRPLKLVYFEIYTGSKGLHQRETAMHEISKNHEEVAKLVASFPQNAEIKKLYELVLAEISQTSAYKNYLRDSNDADPPYVPPYRRPNS